MPRRGVAWLKPVWSDGQQRWHHDDACTPRVSPCTPAWQCNNNPPLSHATTRRTSSARAASTCECVLGEGVGCLIRNDLQPALGCGHVADTSITPLFLHHRSTTVFSHSQTVVVCPSCNTVLCTPSGGKARLTEGACVGMHGCQGPHLLAMHASREGGGASLTCELCCPAILRFTTYLPS